jgi:hypothetical protein
VAWDLVGYVVPYTLVDFGRLGRNPDPIKNIDFNMYDKYYEFIEMHIQNFNF